MYDRLRFNLLKGPCFPIAPLLQKQLDVVEGRIEPTQGPNLTHQPNTGRILALTSQVKLVRRVHSCTAGTHNL